MDAVPLQTVQPKLRMVLNGNDAVNAIRAEHCAALTSESDLPIARGPGAAPKTKSQLAADDSRGKLRAIPKGRANVFVTLADAGRAIQPEPGDDVRPQQVVGADAVLKRGTDVIRKLDMATATVDLAGLEKLRSDPGVAYLELGEPLTAPTPSDVRDHDRPRMNLRKIGDGRRHRYGANVLIGIVDVQGFDFTHSDFLDRNHNTRFVAIWDQGGDARPAPAERSPLDRRRRPSSARQALGYGAEFQQSDLNAALVASRRPGGLPAQYLERQSQMVPGSHGTHVASIAAGNRGICRAAKLAGVVVHLPDDDLERRRSFYDSTRLAHAIDYLMGLGEELGLPVAINVSLGTNGHAHDGSSTVSRWIDAALASPGRAVIAAAGNAGQESPQFEGDIGYVMGRVHTSGRIAASGLVSDLQWNVVGNTVADLSENELEIWYGSQDRFAVSLTSPKGDVIGPIEPGQFVENRQLSDGAMVSVYNEPYHPANGENYIAVYLSPFFGRTGVVGVTAGPWRVRLHGLDVRDGAYHAWIERDDPRRVGRIGPKDAWVFPSFFASGSYVDQSTVSSLACGRRIISVANLDGGLGRIHHTSSQGPTRDGRAKPDVAAPGTKITAAKGFAGDPDAWIEMTGTSMSAPFVTGIVGLMLSAKPTLTAAQIEGILRRTARPLPGADYAWQDAAGFGQIDPDRCLDEAINISRRVDKT